MSVEYDTFLSWVESHFDDVEAKGKDIKINSIFTDDTKRHLWCCPKKDAFHCWKTGEKGSLAKLVSIVDNCTYAEARERIGGRDSLAMLEAKFYQVFGGESFPKVEKPDNRVKLPPETYRIASLSPANSYRIKAEKYLDNRRLPISNLMICTSGKHKDRIIIPYYGPKGELIYWNGRDITDKAYLRYCGPEKEEVGFGKCFQKDTLVLMYNGDVKCVQDIVEGDILMGPDSKPRIVKHTTTGYGQLYKVTPKKGTPYVVNGDHVLALYYGRTRISLNISVKDYLNLSKTYKKNCWGYRSAVEFNTKPTLINPYIFGIWLGDGTSRCSDITNVDKEIISEWYNEATNRGLTIKTEQWKGMGCSHYRISCETKNGNNSFIKDLRTLGVFGNKHIPKIYLCNDRKTRLSLLAGYLDADGSLIGNCYDFICKSYRLAKDIEFLARSLGFSCYVKSTTKSSQTGKHAVYYRGIISGNVNEIPLRIERKKSCVRKCKKNVLRTSITVEPVSYGDYYGFSVDKDHLFLLGDFTVVHNCDVLWFAKWPEKGTRVYLTEGEFDAMSLIQAGFVAAACGGKNVGPKQLELLRPYKIAISFDTDKSGAGALNKVGETFEYEGIGDTTIIRPPTIYKDWNAMLQQLGPKLIRAYVQQNEQCVDAFTLTTLSIFSR